MANAIPRICIAMGDPAGISAEVLAKLLSRAYLMRLARVCVIGDRRFLAEGEKIAGAKSDVAVVAPSAIEQAAAGKPLFVDLGHLDPATIRRAQASAEGGAFAMRNFREALLSAKAGRFDGILFTPLNKLALKLAGNPHPDEIRWAASVLEWKGPCSEYNRLDDLWNARVTSHEPLREVPGMLSRERIAGAIEATAAMLAATGLARPRIAVAGLNPHAGEGCVFGREEIDVIAPAVEDGRRRGRRGTDPGRPAGADRDARARHRLRHRRARDRRSLGDDQGIRDRGRARFKARCARGGVRDRRARWRGSTRRTAERSRSSIRISISGISRTIIIRGCAIRPPSRSATAIIRRSSAAICLPTTAATPRLSVSSRPCTSRRNGIAPIRSARRAGWRRSVKRSICRAPASAMPG